MVNEVTSGGSRGLVRNRGEDYKPSQVVDNRQNVTLAPGGRVRFHKSIATT